jgi:hypothetical protein
MTALPHDTDLTAWWCANLPTLTAAADKQCWRHLLDAANDDIRAGTPVRDALTTHHLDALLDEPTTATPKSWTGPADLGELTPAVPVVGAYTCPTTGRRCGRSADADRATGYEPRCGLHRLPMTRQAPPPERVRD